MFAHQRKRVQLLFAVADALLTIVAFEAAYWTRTQLAFDRIFFLHAKPHVLLILVAAAVWVALGSHQRVYEYLDSANGSRMWGRTLRQCLFGTALVILFQYLMRLDPPLSRSFLSLFFLYDFALLVLFRRQSPQLVGAFHRGFGTPYHIVLVGSPAKTASLGRKLTDGSPFRLKVSAMLTADECAREIPELLARQVVDEVIFTVDSDRLSELEAVFLRCDEEGVRTRVAIDFFPHVNSEITLDRVGEAPLLTFSAAPMDDLRLLTKRLIDITGSALAMVLLSPAILLIAVLIKTTSRGPVIYRQARCGLNGRLFTIYKFRSMVENADELRGQLEHLNERQVAFKLARDPRGTPVGRFLRKYSIDEWPQFWNVLRGEMSLVGPRPPVPAEVEHYERWQKRRLRMRPGLTCLWALMGRDQLDFNAWMRTDISYIDNWSLKLDWAILLKTIPQVLAGKGAH